MKSRELFEMALQLQSPWYIEKIEYDAESKDSGRLDIFINFHKGGEFKDSQGNLCKAYDTRQRSWQHLNFFQSPCFIHARVPRIKSETDGITIAEVPWARKGSGFTLLFEAFSMLLIEKEMPVKQVSETLKVYDNRVWRVFNHYVDEAVSKDDLSEITCIGIDETSARKGHKYVTIAVDMKTKRVIHATEGKDAKTIESIAKNLEAKGGDPKAVTQASIDMSPSFIAGIMDNLPEAEITFDKFHISKMLNEAVDDVRKKERREHNELKGHKYLFLKSDKKLTKEQIELREDLMLAFPGLAKAVQLRELFNDFWNMEDMNESQAFLSYWCDLTEESGVEPFRKFVAIIKKHWSGIVNYLKSKITNGILEGINSKIQIAKKRARGYRNTKYFINMIYFIAGKLKLDYPHFST